LTEEAKNLAASVHRRLLNSAGQNDEDFNQVLAQYAIERLLYRLGELVHRDRFVLKGASLYLVWQRDNSALTYRPTRDLDLWMSGSPQSEDLERNAPLPGAPKRQAHSRGRLLRKGVLALKSAHRVSTNNTSPKMAARWRGGNWLSSGREIIVAVKNASMRRGLGHPKCIRHFFLLRAGNPHLPR
jgi:hypothetical protein